MDYRLLADTAILAGEIMTVSGAETYRVEETMYRILKVSGLSRTESLAYTTGLMITLEGEGVPAITLVRRVGEKSTDLGRIYETNQISRSLCAGELQVEEAYASLAALAEQKKTYPAWVVYLCLVITSAAFAILLGGNLLECVFAALNGVFFVGALAANEKIKMNRFILHMLVAFFMACCSLMLQRAFGERLRLEMLIAGSIMPMLPGVAITNALRDTLQGDYMSGGVRAIEAFIAALAIAVGIGCGLSLGNVFIGGGLL